MRIPVTIVLFVLSLASCNCQQVKKNTAHKRTIKTNTMERFNKALFDQKKTGDHYEFTLEDGTIVHQMESPPDYYVEKTSNPKTNFKTYKEYYFSNGNLKTSGREFYAFPVGVWKE